MTVGWAISDAVFGYDSTYSYPTVSRQFDNTYTVAFYENPANASVVVPFEKDATTNIANSVNATVQMFNYDANVNGEANPLSFWNGYWGYGGVIESKDGAGVEDNTYRFPYLSQELDANGYPVFYPYVEDASGKYYKTTDGQYVLVSSVTDSEGNITNEKVISSVRYRVGKTNPISLGYLFGNGVTADQYGQAQANGVTTFAPMANGGGLFRHDPNTGNYFYDSMQNAAWYDAENNKFVLYDSLIVRPWYNSTAGMDYDLSASAAYDKFMDAGYMSSLSVADPESYGNFLPFNKVTTDNITLDGAVYDYTDRAADDRFISAEDYSAIVRANILAGTLERYGLTPATAQKVLASNKSLSADLVEIINDTYHYSKGLYTARLEEKMDMWFGMTVDFDFFQPYNGQTKTASGEVSDMVFDFEGDDDVFVYIGVWNDQTNQYDYKLVLDIGGIHEARNGNINFATGAVSYQNCYGENISTTLGEIFDLNTATFDDFEKLSLKFFYMERGGNISCCRLSFNLPTLPNNSLTVSKALDTAVLGTQTYKFRVLKTELNDENQYVATEESLIPAGTYYYTGTSEAFLVDANGYFEMDPGQSVTFNNIAQYITDNNYYYAVEEIITSTEADGQYTPASPEYTLNGSSPLQAKGGLASGGVYVYRTEPMKMNVGEGSTTNLVGFTNLVDTSKLGSLHITKQIKEGANISADASFDMRVTLGGSLLPVGTQYKIYSAGDTENFTVATVKTRGIVTLKAGQTVVIEKILSTSTIEVVEDSSAYSASYYSESSSIKCSGSGAVGTMPLGGTIEIIVTNDDSNVITDKTVSPVAGSTDRFILTLEAFATGKTNTVALTAPADIVLVLDQSASMYTPKGAGADQYTYTDDVKLNSNLTRYDLAATLDPNVTIAGTSLNLEKAAKTGYYVAQSKTANRTNTSVGDIYDWFVVQYDKSDDKWYYNRITSTTVSVEFFKDEAVAYDASSSAQYNDFAKKFTTTIVADEPIDTLYYYESQYAALYESVINFADNLKSTGVDHRISIVGFSSPYYDGIKAYNGSGVYVGGDYYLYDTDYEYKGFLFGGRTQNITFMLAALNAHEDAPEQNVPGTDGEQSPETSDTNIELLALVTLTACVLMLAVLILPSVHKRIVK